MPTGRYERIMPAAGGRCTSDPQHRTPRPRDRTIGIGAGSLLGPGLIESAMLLLTPENRYMLRRKVWQAAEMRRGPAGGEVRVVLPEGHAHGRLEGPQLAGSFGGGNTWRASGAAGIRWG
jgi:hypothetical protein